MLRINLATNFLYFCFGIVFFVSLASCGHPSNKVGSGANSGLLRRALRGEPTSLDPAAAPDNFSFQVLQDLYEGLTTESPAGSVLPGVASSWTVDSTGTQYTFELRADARWSNGKPVRAQDFITAWQRVVDPKHGSPVADDLRPIAGAEAIIKGQLPPSALGVYARDNNHLLVKLEQPAAYLPQLLSHSSAFPIYSEASARARTPENWISNGPYVLLNWQPGTKIEIRQNLNYWNRASVHIPRVEYQFVADEASQFARYRADEIDLTDTVPANAIPMLRDQHDAELVIAPYLGTVYYGLNLSVSPIAENLKLRKALAMAIDRSRLVDVLGFGQTPAYGFLPPGIWNYAPQSWQWKDLSDANRVAEARTLYLQAGYKLNSPVHLRVLFNANPIIRRTAVLIASMWKETLGIETELDDEEFRVFLHSVRDKSRWEVARLGWTADFNDASSFLNVFRNGSANNYVGYADPSFDSLLDDAASTRDSEHRRTTLEAAERLLLDDYAIIPIYYLVSKRLVKPYVLGVKPDLMDRVPSKALTINVH
jgi:oligopeptide transport system substrate-binding protein